MVHKQRSKIYTKKKTKLRINVTITLMKNSVENKASIEYWTKEKERDSALAAEFTIATITTTTTAKNRIYPKKKKQQNSRNMFARHTEGIKRWCEAHVTGNETQLVINLLYLLLVRRDAREKFSFIHFLNA